ncbi:MAG TPA: hypothetical protein VHV30_00925, partial [Polyangiaceae bacterium]|nr:hypothetical protein [Polyangiaceae bacterium]
MRSEPAVLLLTALRLYDTGVGYFERTGSLDAERTTLPVPASHLDDALASLVVLTPGAGAVVHGLTFDSRLTGGMARALAGLPPGSDGAMGWRVLLGSLKGVHVEVRAGTSTFVGRLVDVEGPDEPSSMLVLVTDRADLVRVPATAVQSVHPTDGSFSRRLDAALDATGAQAARERRWIDVLGEAGGHGPVTIGYVAETPLWRTTYRIVLAPDGGRSRLQGWALVHNDTDEDWQGVRVALVNGRPDSFLYPLAAPRYARRALLRPDDALSTVPQLLGQSPDSLWGDNVDDDASAGGLGLSGEGAGGGGRGEGIGLGSIGTIGHGSGTYMEVLNGTDAEAAQTPPATGAEAGALFVYSLPDRLSLRAHGSALLPFVDAPIEATPVAWVEGDQPARTAVRVVNSTAQTLPPGPVSFFFAGGFSGESGLDRLKPGDRRFVRYGMDLDVEAKVTPGRAPSTREAPKHLTFDRDALIEHFERKTDTAHTIENRSGVARDVDLVLGV